jgi:hypothetical protein
MTGKSPEEHKRLDEMLRGVFRTLERRPIPSHLRSVVDQLDDGRAAEVRRARRR